MFKIDMEFRKGALIVRMEGSFTKRNIGVFSNEVYPVILKHNLKHVILNLNYVSNIDIYGINSLIELNDIVGKWNGKTTLCSVNTNIKNDVLKDQVALKYYEASDELTALEVRDTGKRFRGGFKRK